MQDKTDLEKLAQCEPGDRVLPNGRMMEEYYKPFPPNHFAAKLGDVKLNVVIIGAGIAGLTTAIALLQAGHDVEIFERSRFANEIGAAINVCPNAARILSHYEFNFSRGRPTWVEEFTLMNAQTLDILAKSDIPDFTQLYGQPWYLYHRVDLHNELKRMTTESRPHTSAVAKLHLATGVREISLDGSIVLDDGKRMMKDLIVVADGVRSKFVTKVVGEDTYTRAMPTGTAVYRFLIPTEKLLADPQTKKFYPDNKFNMTIAPYDDVRLVSYPCRGGTIQNYGYFHPDEIEGYEDEVWNIPASWDKFMETSKKVHPDIQAILQKAEDLKLWRLVERRQPLRTLTKGKVVLVGDAAHPMLPHQGQGGGMAIEDGAALGVLLSNLQSRHDVESRLHLYQQLRLDRVTAMQIFSRVGQDQAEQIAQLARPYVKGPLPTSPREFYDYNFTPNILRDAYELLSQHQRPTDSKAAGVDHVDKGKGVVVNETVGVLSGKNQVLAH